MPLKILSLLRCDRDVLQDASLVAIGDMAFDRTFLCSKSSTTDPAHHAIHAGEPIYNIIDDGDDFGTVGSICNVPRLWRNLGASCALVTVVGDDQEGHVALAELSRMENDGVRTSTLILPDVQTTARLRCFAFDEEADTYRLEFRMDKEPHYRDAAQKSLTALRDRGRREWIRSQLQTAQVLYICDTDKGFITDDTIALLAEELESANEHRAANELPRILTVVDPKLQWDKYRPLTVDVLKPNHVRAMEVLGQEFADLADPVQARELAARVFDEYGAVYPCIVITLGKTGAILVHSTPTGADITFFQGVPIAPSYFYVSTACGDMFGAAMALALAVVKGGVEEIEDAILFANYVGSLQAAKKTGDKVTGDDILKQENIENWGCAHACSRQMEPLVNEKEQVANNIITSIGDRLSVEDATFVWKGRQSELIAAPPFAKHLAQLGELLRPGRMVLLDGESRSGKGAIIGNLGVFVPGFEEELDCHAASTVLASVAALDEHIKRTAERKTCLVLDEIQDVGNDGLAILKNRFPDVPFDGEFCLLLAGDVANKDGFDEHILSRASRFHVPPYADTIRRHDIPFLLADIIKKQDGGVKRITAGSLAILVRLDYEKTGYKNYGGLKKILLGSCDKVTSDLLTVADLILGPFEACVDRQARYARDDVRIITIE